MKKYWKFLSAWLLLIVFVGLNALSYYGDHVAMPYIAWIAQSWIVLEILLLVIGGLYFAYKLVPSFAEKTNRVSGKVFTPKVKNFFRIDKTKAVTALIIVAAVFVLGLLCTLIKSTHYEHIFATAFYIFAPEYTLGSWAFYNWIDGAFFFATLLVVIGKWFLSYCVAALIASRKKTLQEQIDVPEVPVE